MEVVIGLVIAIVATIVANAIAGFIYDQKHGQGSWEGEKITPKDHDYDCQ